MNDGKGGATLEGKVGTLDGRMVGIDNELRDLKTSQRAMAEDITSIKDTLNQARGGWKTLMLVAGFSSLFGALFAKAGGWISLLPK